MAPTASALGKQIAPESFGQSRCSAMGLLFCKRCSRPVHSRPCSLTQSVAVLRFEAGRRRPSVATGALVHSSLARAFGVVAGLRRRFGPLSYRRYALYLTPPPESDLWRFGCDVIGRDALTGDLRAGFAPEGHELEAWHDLTSDPRRYGFHATLKAPFRPERTSTPST